MKRQINEVDNVFDFDEQLGPEFRQGLIVPDFPVRYVYFGDDDDDGMGALLIQTGDLYIYDYNWGSSSGQRTNLMATKHELGYDVSLSKLAEMPEEHLISVLESCGRRLAG